MSSTKINSLGEWALRHDQRFLFVGLPDERAVALEVRAGMGQQSGHTAIWMEPGAHTTYAAWRLLPEGEPQEEDGLSLRVILLANNRDHHGTTRIGGSPPWRRA